MQKFLDRASLRTAIACVTLVLLALLLYANCLKKYFAMEDFLCISWVQKEGFEGVMKSFYTDNEFGVYRPISIHVFYYVCRLLFGTNPLGYHFINLGSHILNILLVFTLAALVTGDRWLGFLAGVVYLSRLSHFIGVFWIAGINEVWLALFYLISLAGFVRFSQTKKILYLAASLVSFALALSCKESAITLPGALLAYGFFMEKRLDLKKLALEYVPFFVVLAAYLFLKLVVLKPMVGQTYKVGVGIWLFRNLLAYGLWQVNITHLLLLYARLFLRIMLYELLENESLLWCILGVSLAAGIGLAYLFRKQLHRSVLERDIDPRARFALTGAAFFAVSLIPALLLKNRVQPYYLFVPSIGFSIAAASLMVRYLNKFWASAVAFLIVVGACFGYLWMEKLPDGRTTTMARPFLEELNDMISKKENVSSVYVENGSTFLYQVLWYGEAFKSFLKKPMPVVFDFQEPEAPKGGTVLRAYYDGEHLTEISP